MKLRKWLSVRGPAYAVSRGRTLLKRYRIAPAEAMDRVERCVAALALHGCQPTLPTPGRVVQSHPQFLRHLQELGAEIAVHSYDHVDLAALTPAEGKRQLLKAAEVFEQHEIEVFGFRCPYLRCTDELIETIPNGAFGYSSNRAIRWETSPDSVAGAPQGVEVLQHLYEPAAASDTVCTPWMHALVVEIPVCLPDDLELVDGLQLGREGLAQAWVEVLYQTHQRGELFDLLFHPELAGKCQEPIVSVLQKAADLVPGVWVARLRDISAWWREKAGFSVTISQTTEGLRVSFDCTNRATILVRGLDGNGFQRPWDGEYQRLHARVLHVPGGIRPFVGLPPNAPKRVLSFLREEGYILDTGTTAARCAIYLDAATLDGLTCNLDLVDLVESSPGPLARYWRWPDGARSALCVSGDLDALTLTDYASRLFTR